MAAGVANSLFAAAVGKASSLTAGEIWNHFRRSAFDGDFDDPTQRFTARLRRKLADVAERRDLDSLADLVENEDWEELVEEFDESAVLTATSAEAEIEAVVEAIAEATDLDLSDPAREELKNAVGTATADALEWFEDEAVGTELGERWQLEREEALREEVIAEYRRVGRQATREAFDLRDADREGFEAIAEQIEVEDVEFVPRPELEGEPSADKILLVGWAGAGKSRALKELLERLSQEDHGLAHVVHPNEEFLNTDQISPLVNQSFEGDVLLVWDDVRRLDPENPEGTFQSTIHRLEGALNEEGHGLHVLAAGRSEALDEVPSSGESPIEGPWSEFEPVVLDERGEDFLESLVDKAVEHYEVEASIEVRRNLAEVAADVHPSPFYVTSVLEVAVDEGGELTDELIAELPEDSEKLWRRQNRKLRKSNEDAHYLLRAMRFLSRFGIPRRKGLVEGTYKEAFDKDGFADAAETLARKHWVSTYGDASVTDDDARYYVHDVKLAAVEEDDQDKIPAFSEFVRDRLWLYTDEKEIEIRTNGQFALAMENDPKNDTDQYAKKHYEAVLEEPGYDHSLTHYNYALFWKNRNDISKAKMHYKKAIREDPTFATAHANYGVLLEEQGRELEALREYALAISVNDRVSFAGILSILIRNHHYLLKSPKVDSTWANDLEIELLEGKVPEDDRGGYFVKADDSISNQLKKILSSLGGDES